MKPIINSKYLILTQNERTFEGRFDHWEDVLGEIYHYPNIYKNIIQPGYEFIYYRGVRRTKGIGKPGYIGFGVIGDVWLDDRTESLPKKNWKWFCDIRNYIPFMLDVPIKEGVDYHEKIKSQSDFRSGVRRTDRSILYKIIKIKGMKCKTNPHEKQT